jgi:dihydrofolate synthase/folylpolyglutamate synthase
VNFDESIKYLYSLGHETLAMKLDLENTRRLLSALGEPQKSFLKIQIAGTNGKGSTAAFLDSICRAAQIKTGLFTSPHLVSITERIRINGIENAGAKFAELTSKVKETAENLVKEKTLITLPTFFEHLTAIGLLAFSGEEVDLAILETGLGGRLDSTTAAESEIACLTPIDLDHQEYLGDTIEKIAAEKAAVIHSQTRAVIVSKQKSAALNVILKQCAEFGIKPIIIGCRYEVGSATADGKIIATFRTANQTYENVRLNLRGRHQLENAATAIVTAENLKDFSISPDAIVKGLETATHAGRLEIQGNILFDGAHNAAGAKALGEFLQEFAQNKITLVFGAMRDKDLSEIASILFPLAENLILTRAENPRSAAPETLLSSVPRGFPAEKVFVTETVSEAIKKARRISALKDTICITGSLYLVGEAKSIMN